VYRAPVRRPSRGRPRLHGTPFRLRDTRTHGKPRESAQLDHPLYGTVHIDVWSDLLVRGAPDAPFSVIRVQVERLPKMKQAPHPLWLAWIGAEYRERPSDTDRVSTIELRVPRGTNPTVETCCKICCKTGRKPAATASNVGHATRRF
jgi:hypothetical protein